MRNIVRLGLLVLAFASTVSGQSAPRPTSQSFRITGQITEPRSYTLADIQALPAKEITLEYTAANQPQKHTFKGVPLWDIISSAKPQFDANVKNDSLRWVLQAQGSDGYAATFALGELDPNFGNKGVLVAYEQDGKPPSAEDGLMRLVVPGDVKGGRFVSALVTVIVRRIQ
jgi:DMSO/TMAO reductase YedYZ molybdopterin-dependent catalytic subunit